MDMTLPVPKKKGCFECVDIIDWISKLPDEILAKVLNYLPTKQAVATSILSKRWEYLWTLTSDLDFNDHWLRLADYRGESEIVCMIKSRSLKKYVDRVIFYHGGSNIRKCHVYFSTKYVASSVYTWICAVITCNIQELSLNCFDSKFNTYYHLPCRLFSCNTLVVLKINGNFVLDVPTYVCFPCLKLLHIKKAVLVDDASMERLFSSCPVLEELSIQRSLYNNCLHIMNISIPSLKILCIYNSRYDSVQTKINTPCLEYLEIHDKEGAPSRYFVNFTSSLVRSNLVGFDIFILNAISQVEYLSLTGNDRSLENIIRDSALPIFKNLKTLNLLVKWSKPSDWKVLPNLLDSSPNLQLLIFPKGLVTYNLLGEDFNHFDWQWPEFVPKCLSLHLKTIEIFAFVGFQEELDIVEYLLESAKVLEEMIIHRFDVSKKNRIMEEIAKGDNAVFEQFSLRRNSSTSEVMSFKRSCSTCQVIFTD